MANITMQQFIDQFNAAFATDDDALDAVTGLGYQWSSLKAQAQATAKRAQAQQTTQAAEKEAQWADQAQQVAQGAFVGFVAGLSQ